MSTLDRDRWEAVRDRRDGAAFIFGVRTTRVACRPGCPSRTPDRRNVQYFDDFTCAERAGYRACKRCAPDAAGDALRDRRRSIERACTMLAQADAPSIEVVAATVGLSRFHFQRVFRAATGITPAAYRRALRDRRFREYLAGGASVTQAMHDAGFGSASRAYGADVVGMPPSSFKRGGRGEHLRYACAASRFGRVLVAMSERGVAAIELGDDDGEALEQLRRHFPHARLERAQVELDETVANVVRMVDDPGVDVHLELDIRGTAFQRRIWDALRRVPSGSRVSYGELASAAGVPGAARAAAAACAANRLAVAIPCHRAVRGDGDTSGYRWGVARKAAILEEERKQQCLNSDSSATVHARSSTTRPDRSSITRML